MKNVLTFIIRNGTYVICGTTWSAVQHFAMGETNCMILNQSLKVVISALSRVILG
ncbi:hypothetical protein PAJ34TS1_26990 [Paenibacillus azoreducens]